MCDLSKNHEKNHAKNKEDVKSIKKNTQTCLDKRPRFTMNNMLEIVLHRLIHAVDNSVLEIQNALKVTLETMGKVFKPSTFLKCALPILATLNGTPLQMMLNLNDLIDFHIIKNNTSA